MLMKNQSTAYSILLYAITDEILQERFYQLNELEAALNKHIQLEDYGSVLQKLNYTFIALRPDESIHENELSICNNQLAVKKQLDYQEALQAEPPDFFLLLTFTLYHSVKELDFSPLDFDLQQFEKDLKRVCVKHGWLG